MVARSSNNQVMLGPTCTVRSCLWAMISARRRGRSSEYCSSVIKSWRASFCMRSSLKPVGHSEQRQGMDGRGFPAQAALDLMAGHRTIARVEVRTARLDALDHGLGDFHRSLAKFPLDSIGAIVTGAPFDGLDAGAGNELQDV